MALSILEKFACARWLVLLGTESKRIHVNTSVWVTGVVLVWLHKIEVRALTLREAILAVQLKLGGHNRVLTPAVHVESSLGHHEGASIRDTRVSDCRSCVIEAAAKGSCSDCGIGTSGADAAWAAAKGTWS